MPFTPTVLITSAPSFLHSFRAVREWLQPCGTARVAVFHPRVPSRRRRDGGGDGGESEALPPDGGGDGEGRGGHLSPSSPSPPANRKVQILVTMAHPDSALKFVGSFPEFAKRLDERYHTIQAHMVPSSPDLPLPPPTVDEETRRVLGEKLWQNFVGLEAEEPHDEDGGGGGGTRPTPAVAVAVAADADRTDPTSGGEDGSAPSAGANPKLDADKVAAAAGGLYDADEDPLNAPQVLEAVKAFRRRLDKTQALQKKKRAELVAKKAAEMRPKVEAQMREDREDRRRAAPHRGGGGGAGAGGGQRHPGGLPPLLLPPPLPLPLPQASLPQPPLPPGMGGSVAVPLPPSGLPPPPLPPPLSGSAADSGKRGRSNLPAWMTQQQPEGTDGEEPVSKRTRASDAAAAATGGRHPARFPPSLPPSAHGALRTFLTAQVRESLGEEETTLIDFVYTHVLGGGATSDLLQELQVVLEDEADGFLDTVWAKVDDLTRG